MNPSALFKRHMKKSIRDLRVEVTINGTVYKGTMSNRTEGDSLEIEGVRIEETSYIAFLRDDFTTLPALEDLVTIDSVQYRIKSLDFSQCNEVFYVYYENKEA